ncbi:MAG: PilN domain-containing protein [Mycobacteriales bacterium]
MSLALRRRAASGTELRGPSIPRVNLLPPEVVEIRRFRRVQYGLGGAVLAALGIVVLLLVLALGTVSSAQRRVDETQAQQTQLQGRLAKLGGVRQVYAQVAAGETQLRTAMGGEVQWSHYLNDLSLTIPKNVWLTNIAVNLTAAGPGAPTAAAAPPGAGANPIATPGIGVMTATGTAFSHDDVARWLRSLARQKGYADPYFSNSTVSAAGVRRTVTFSSSVTITTAALSHRFDRLPGA